MGSTGQAAGLLPWRKVCEGKGDSPGKLALSEGCQEHAPSPPLSVRAAMKGTLFIWQFKQRDTHVWAHSPSAGQLPRECYEGALIPLPKWGTLKHGIQRNDIETTEGEEEKDKGF